MHDRSLSIAVALGISFIAPVIGRVVAQQPQQTPPSPQATTARRPSDEEASSKTWQRLQQDASLSGEEKTLRRILDSLSQQGKYQVLFDHRRLDKENISLDAAAPAFKLNNVSHAIILQLVLDPHDLDYALIQGIVFISTRDKIRHDHLTVQVYDVRDLIGLPATSKLPSTAAAASEAQAEDEQPDRFGTVRELADTVMETVDPDSWAAVGDGWATISTYHTVLVVRQTYRNHREVERLLDKLRQTVHTVGATATNSREKQR